MDTFKLRDFAGGLNKTGEYSLADNEAVDLQNVVFSDIAALSKRKGYFRITATPLDESPVTGIHVLNQKDGKRFILAQTVSGIWAINEGIGEYQNIKTGLHFNYPFRFAPFLNKGYFANGVDPLIEFDGQEFSENTKAPVGRFIEVKDNVMYISGDIQHPSRVYYSEIADTDDWTGWDEITNHFEVLTDDGDSITGIVRQNGNLVIFKNNKIFVLYGTDSSNYVLREMHSNIGCIAPGSIVNVLNNVFFLARDGIYIFDGVNVNLISHKIRPLLSKILHIQKVQATFYEQLYLLSFAEGDSEYNNRILAYDVFRQAWSYFTGINANCFSNFDSQRGYVYFGDSAKGLVYNLMPRDKEIYSDDGKDIEIRFTSKPFDFDAPEVIKTFRKILVEMESETDLSVTISIDKGGNVRNFPIPGQAGANPKFLWGSKWGEMIWRKNSIKSFGKSITGGTYGSNISLNLRNSSSLPLKLLGITMEILPRRQKFYVR